MSAMGFEKIKNKLSSWQVPAWLRRYSKILQNRSGIFRKLMTEEMRLPDIKGRHLFTARLRIVIFIGTWLMFFFIFPGIWKVAPFVPLTFNICFFITALCYLHVIRYNKLYLSVLLLEIFADIISQTVLIYILGFEGWAPFLIYGMYIFAIGILSGYYASLIASTLALVVYNLMFVLLHVGALPEFYYPVSWGGVISMQNNQHFLNLVILPVSFVLIVYSIRIANFFSNMKEKALQQRNVQLTALNHIGATIRGVVNVNKVIDEVLKAVVQGLGFDVCFLALVNENTRELQFFFPQNNYFSLRLADILGVPFDKMRLSLDARHNSIGMAIKRNRVLVRNSFNEIVYGIEPQIQLHHSLRAQKVLGFKKFVITPLVAEQKVIGAIIGASQKSYIQENIIDTLDHFANQAALAIESSELIGVLEQKNKELVKANQVKTDFLAIMSHELRTPLNAVLGYTEAIKDGVMGEINEEQKKSLDEVYRNGENLLQLINSTLDLAKIEAGKMDLNLHEFDLIELIENVHSSLRPLLEQKKHKFQMVAPSKLPFVRADAMHLRQILTNLVGNSIKFTDEGGRIVVSVEFHETIDKLAQTEFKSESFPSHYLDLPGFVIRVKDNGIGMTLKDQKNIFELFKQADSSYTRHHEGTGLGLALTKQLVVLHSGAIVIESELNKGSEFKILLPQLGAQAS